MADKLGDPEMGMDAGGGMAALEKKGAFLSGPPRSGELSPFAQKIATQAFVWLASIIVFGATSDVARVSGKCNSLCSYGIAVGVVSFIFTSMIMVAHYMCWAGTMDRNGWFTSAAERRFMIALVMWWGPGVGGLSAVLRNNAGASYHTNGVAIFFGWLAFFGSIYGAYKCYHVQQEEESYMNLHQQMTIEAEDNVDEYANFS